MRSSRTASLLTTQYDGLADRTVVLDRGRVAAQGTAAQLKTLVPGAADLDNVFLAITGTEQECLS